MREPLSQPLPLGMGKIVRVLRDDTTPVDGAYFYIKIAANTQRLRFRVTGEIVATAHVCPVWALPAPPPPFPPPEPVSYNLSDTPTDWLVMPVQAEETYYAFAGLYQTGDMSWNLCARTFITKVQLMGGVTWTFGFVDTQPQLIDPPVGDYTVQFALEDLVPFNPEHFRGRKKKAAEV
jgi:hypothetical protein